MVVWFLGKSGSGKTFFGQKLYLKIKENHRNTVYLDGDELRSAISEDLGHSEEDRYTSEKRRSRLCKLLSDQGIYVICSGISNVPKIREWNKKNIKNYFEIYLKTNQQTLYSRDPKGLYKRYLNGEISSIVGEDIKFNEPISPWLEIYNNSEDNLNADDCINEVVGKLIKNKII